MIGNKTKRICCQVTMIKCGCSWTCSDVNCCPVDVLHTYIHACIHAYVHTCIHTGMHVRTYTHTWYIYIYIYIYVSCNIYALRTGVNIIMSFRQSFRQASVRFRLCSFLLLLHLCFGSQLRTVLGPQTGRPAGTRNGPRGTNGPEGAISLQSCFRLLPPFDGVAIW